MVYQTTRTHNPKGYVSATLEQKSPRENPLRRAAPSSASGGQPVVISRWAPLLYHGVDCQRLDDDPTTTTTTFGACYVASVVDATCLARGSLEALGDATWQ